MEFSITLVSEHTIIRSMFQDEVLDNSELLVACYFIIESAVSYMAGGGGGHHSSSQVLDSKQRGQLYAALKNAFGTILKVSDTL